MEKTQKSVKIEFRSSTDNDKQSNNYLKSHPMIPMISSSTNELN